MNFKNKEYKNTFISYPSILVSTNARFEKFFSKRLGSAKKFDSNIVNNTMRSQSSNPSATGILWGHFLIVSIASASISLLTYYLTQVRGFRLNPFSRSSDNSNKTVNPSNAKVSTTTTLEV